MSEEYSLYKLGKHVTLSLIIGTLLLWQVKIGAELGIVDEGMKNLSMLAGYALFGYAMLPGLLLVGPAIDFAKEKYANRSA